ncbi:sugar ABC transporter ATP-binding protein [Petroclostridium sp. X23]|uniref:sugar ABC transporter ATP-binding protein n=1 Tax=Petroclostridium sp. X23 TaxID=3045146 RepID=UPI0024AC9EEA|nr:sugar ABC transporter ATP-binding protein [Petroclostridium sp. X23]WHH60508.1 sugar ABC transporter ATP-binding protein [Petroclostridium sp. X23]
MQSEILRMECISKSFAGTKVLNNVNMNVLQGEVLALVGANGAGKTSLMKILAGIYTKDSGKVYFNEKEVELNVPSDSQKLGISVIHQELNLIRNLSVAENIFLGNKKYCKPFFISKKEMYKEAEKYLLEVGLNIDPTMYVDRLSVVQKQLVGIARSLATNLSLIIMDESTSSMSEKETCILREIIIKLKSEGISVIFISHQLNEALQIADRIMVLRDGVSIGTYLRAECSEEMLISLMVGSDFEKKAGKLSNSIGEKILQVENISTEELLKDVSFYLRKGEILGFTGLMGSGGTELMKVIFGAMKKNSGIINMKGKEIDIRTPIDAIKNKIGMVPEDRNLEGLILNMSMNENITLPSLRKISLFGIINLCLEKFMAGYYIQRLMIRNVSGSQEVGNLSGGNQQKVLISKWLSIRPEILILNEPTRGIDIASKQEIHQIIRNQAREGIGIILVSSEYKEVLSLCDRIIVMRKGTICGELDRRDVTQEKILTIAVN